MVESYARQLFLFEKIIKKARRACFTRDFIFIYFAGAQCLLRTDVYFLCRVFRQTVLFVSLRSHFAAHQAFLLLLKKSVSFISQFEQQNLHSVRFRKHLVVPNCYRVVIF